jgi:large subunit ribosomal protein L13
MTTKTYRLKAAQIDRSWHVLDAAGRPLGRLASEAARLLLGKHKPDYEPHLAMGDFVVVVNAAHVRLTGHKAEQKVYYRHSGYPGGLRERSFEKQMEMDPRRVVEKAVKGMLPHNSRGRELFRRLKVYSESDHPHTAQVMAGTGARARKRAAQEEAAALTAAKAAPAVEAAPATPAATPAAAPVAAETAAPATEPVAAGDDTPVRTGALSRWLREELDQEATRLGIEIEPDWKKGDVVAAIEAHRASAEGDG